MDGENDMAISFYPDEPTSRWQPEEFQSLLIWGSKKGMSDLVTYSNDVIWIRLSGVWTQASKKSLESTEIEFILEKLSKNNAASAQIKAGKDYDFSLEVKIDRNTKQRFRVCATACQDGWGTGISIVFRSIPDKPPTLKDMMIEQDLIDHAFPDAGLVLVTGTMGSGKSTLLAAILRDIAENQSKHIISYEEPIEFDLMNLNNKGPIVQSSVPFHVKSFMDGIRNATRRAPDVLLVGESRDPVTFKGMLEAAEIGVAAYTTAHTRSVSETVTRIINVFPANQQNQIASTMISCLRLIVHQRLLASPKAGGRYAIREFLNITPSLRKELIKTKIVDLIPTFEEMVKNHGTSLLQQAQKAVKNGYITEQQLKLLERERKDDGLA